jgi:ribonuclease HI
MNPADRKANRLAARIRAREESLLRPEVRRNRRRVSALLTGDFVEIGASGQKWTRSQILDLLATEKFEAPRIEDFTCVPLRKDLVLATYTTVRNNAGASGPARTLRSSLWILKGNRWRLRFHQGTLAA